MIRPILLASTLLVSPAVAHAEQLNVVTSFSILGDMVASVGGDHVSVTTLVGPGEDAHVYEPVPADVVAVTRADLVVVNGLGFEGFLDRLVNAAEGEATVLVATNGIDALETADGHADHDDHEDHDEHTHDDHGHGHDEHAHDEHAHDEHAHDDHAHDEHDHAEHAHDEHAHDDHNHGPLDPHAWHSPEAAKTYIANIAAGLCTASPADCAEFEANAAAYVGELEAVTADITGLLADIPASERIVITSHDAFGYLADAFDLKILSVQGISTASEASAADVASVIDQIRDTGARALFVENVSDPRLLEQIAEETGITVSGRLYSDALSGPEGDASTYLDMMRHNASSIASALLGS
jgi:zinc/manganese transport system substrate-binding protein